MTFTPRTHENGGVCCAAYDTVTGQPVPSPSQCPKCTAHFRALEAPELRTAERPTTRNYTPAPNAYAAGIAQLRAAAGLTEHDKALAEQIARIEAAAAKIAAENDEAFRALAAEPSDHRYAPPNSYAAGLKVLRERGQA